jgi:hypothetical protein
VLATIGEFDSDKFVEGNFSLVKEYGLKMRKMSILEALEGLIISVMLSMWIY